MSHLGLISCLVVVAFVIVTTTTASQHGGGRRVLLQDVDTLVFRDNEHAHRVRSPTVRALSCVGGGSRMDALPGNVTCRNTGWDGTDVTWQCSAELPTGVTLRNADVICEGYSSPEDPYIRAGSCSLDYTLDDRRTTFYPRQDPYQQSPAYTTRVWVRGYEPSSAEIGASLAWFMALLVVALIVGAVSYRMFKHTSATTAPSTVSAPIPVDEAYCHRRRHRCGDVDVASPAHVYHHHNDTDCTGARRVNHYHHDATTTTTATAPTTHYVPAPVFGPATPPPAETTHVSTVGARSKRI